jgi:hypothetical protein
MGVFIFLLGAMMSFAPSTATPPRQSQEEAKLAGILQKAQEYCRRLDRAALDFVCREDVEEEVNKASGPTATTVSAPPPVVMGGGRMLAAPAPVDSFNTTSYLYDYQFIRKGTEVTERRDLLEKSGKKVNKADAAPETRHFKFRDILFGASQLLGESATARHDYKIAKDDKIKGEAVIIITCLPKAEFAGKILSGRAWVRAKDGAVLKIEWDPESFGSYSEVLVVAEKFHMAPAIKSFTEFAMEKNGVRFPSLDVTEEAYSGGGSSKFIRSTTTVKYKSYKFFTVETETGIRTP